jgi:malic enzyme
VPHCKTLLGAIEQMKPTVLIGVSTIAGAFSQEVLKVRGRGVFSGVG